MFTVNFTTSHPPIWVPLDKKQALGLTGALLICSPPCLLGQVGVAVCLGEKASRVGSWNPGWWTSSSEDVCHARPSFDNRHDQSNQVNSEHCGNPAWWSTQLGENKTKKLANSAFGSEPNSFLVERLREQKSVMSRKKTLRSKSSTPPSTTLPAGRSKGQKSAKGNSEPRGPINGVSLPNRPSLSNSSEFYDIAFKVSSLPGRLADLWSSCVHVHHRV